MPELPEVEVVRRGLAPHIIGRTIEDIEVLHPRAVRGQDIPLGDAVAGAGIRGIGRRGKYLWWQLSDDADSPVLFIHLGMSGHLRIGQAPTKHTRIRARLSGGVDVSFIDQRTFGRWLYAPLSAIDHIALDPLDPDFDVVATARALRRRRGPIKSVLLDQTVVSGIGNIYADEALWEAGINPRKRASALRQRDAIALMGAVAGVMRRALAAGGTSFDALYVNVNGESGYFARSLAAYGRTGLPCLRCGRPLERVVIAGRSSHYCPHCQGF